MQLFNSAVVIFLVTSFLPLSVQGQEPSYNADRKRVEITRTDLSATLDGVLDDEIWKNATVISDMHQYQPVDQAAPSERSEFYITYNEDYFYIAARLYDKDPTGISARQLIQGSGLGFDDSFEFVLDTFNNGRTGYQFQVNPNGIRREGLFEGPNSINRDWSGIWLVEAKIDDEGWVAEVAIPFKTLNFNPDSDEWGFSVSRTIARKREDVAWSSFNRRVNPGSAGLIYGIRDINQGLGLDIIPSVATSASEDYISGDTDNLIKPSVDIFYKFTPNLTGALTINTDFSATEVDSRQVNLSRFSLFFPEKRDFFLQDVDIFKFGGLGGGGFNNGGSNGIPFYSRRIGLSSSGQPVDINAGVKLTGRVGNMNVGGLVVQQDEFEALDAQTLFVGRAAMNVMSESTVGAIFTQGDPNSEIDNTLMGVDFHYQNTRFTESRSLRGDAWYQQTSTTGRTGDDKAFGINANLDTQNNGFSGFASYTYFGEDYNPALGFANRTGVETFGVGGNGRYFFKENPIFRNIFTFLRTSKTLKLDTGEVQSQDLFWRMMNINTHRGDQLGFGLNRNKEGLDSDFEIRPGIIIPAGEYSFGGYHIDLKGSNQRSLTPSANFQHGKYYDGNRFQVNAGLEWRPNKYLFFKASYIYQDVKMPQGDFVTRLIAMNANYAINSKWSWINLIQYDNFSNSMGVNSRLHWNPQAGEDLFFVINYNFNSEKVLADLSSRNSEIVLKYTKTFRF